MHTSDTYITIDRLSVFARHGVSPQERTVGNEFTVSAVLRYDATKAMSSDNLEHALNYAVAVDVIKVQMDKPSMLLENVAHRIGFALLAVFPSLASVTLTIVKQHPPIPAQVGEISFTATFAR